MKIKGTIKLNYRHFVTEGGDYRRIIELIVNFIEEGKTRFSGTKIERTIVDSMESYERFYELTTMVLNKENLIKEAKNMISNYYNKKKKQPESIEKIISRINKENIKVEVEIE